MIVVNLACGLANRMFQYSYYLFLRDRGYDVWTDAYHSGRLLHEQVEWNRIFPKAPLKPVFPFHAFMMGGGNDWVSRFRRRYWAQSTHVLQMSSAFDAMLPTKESQYVIGCFQSVQMVEAVRETVQSVFRFMPFVDAYNSRLSAMVSSCESVAIHVRKGRDYQSRIWYHETCPIEYYQASVAYMKHRLGNPIFYVFADNKEWVKKHFDWFDYVLVDGNPSHGYGNHFDMQLMSECKHHIMSNSTYSWWGAYLSRHVQGINVLPKIWFNPASCENYTSESLCFEKWCAL